MKTISRRSRRKSRGQRAGKAFFQGFLRAPLKVGTIVPSSRFLESRVVALADLASREMVVELGAGTGGLTRELLVAMPSRSRLLSVEIDPRFGQVLRNIEDPRLLVQIGSASQFPDVLQQQELPVPDAVISGIPFSTLPRELGRSVIRQIWHALAPGGKFVSYQVSTRVEQLAAPWFGRPHVEMEYRNLPPLRVCCWEKTRGG